MPKWLRAALESFHELFGIDLIALWEALCNADDDQKPIWIVSTDEVVHPHLKRWEAELLIKRLRQDYDLVVLAKNLGKNKVEVVKTYRKDASMSETETSRRKLPICLNYDKSDVVGTLEVDAELADKLGTFVVAPEGTIGESGEIEDVLGMGLIPSMFYDPKKDALPVHVDSRGDLTVGAVRISQSMIFQYGNIEDLVLTPIIVVDEGESRVVGYQLKNRTLGIEGLLADLLPGPYIFVLNDDGTVRNLEAIPAKHVLEVREDGYSLQHPYECRAGGKSLHDCEMWQRVQDRKDDMEEFAHRSMNARYFITFNADADRLELENVEHASAEASAETMTEPQLPVPDLSDAEWGVRMNEGTSDPGAIRPCESKEVAEAAAKGVGVVVHKREDGVWITQDDDPREVDPDSSPPWSGEIIEEGPDA